MTLLAAVSQGVDYYVRVLPAAAGGADTGTVAWVSLARTGGGGGTGVDGAVLTAGGAISTPGWVQVTVSNGVPGDTVTFAIDGGATVFTTTLDDLGQIIGTAVPVPLLNEGTHTVNITTSTLTLSTTFDVVNVTSYPVPSAANTGAAVVAQTGVVRWVLQDPAGTNLIFPINPSKMSAPHAARVYATEHSTAPDGQPLTFEGASVGVDWTLEGTCRTQEFHDGLETFLAMPKRVYLLDHLSRAWTVSVESIAWARLPEAYNDWAFTYVLKAIILDGPVQV